MQDVLLDFDKISLAYAFVVVDQKLENVLSLYVDLRLAQIVLVQLLAKIEKNVLENILLKIFGKCF